MIVKRETANGKREREFHIRNSRLIGNCKIFDAGNIFIKLDNREQFHFSRLPFHGRTSIKKLEHEKTNLAIPIDY